MSDERTELVQVMAVAAASIETAQWGTAEFEAWVTASDGGPAMQGMEVLDLVALERMRQDAKWGPQSHGRGEWAMILAEEIGEWAEEVLAHADDPAIGHVLELLIDAGAAAREWLENHEWPERQQTVYDSEKEARSG